MNALNIFMVWQPWIIGKTLFPSYWTAVAALFLIMRARLHLFGQSLEIELERPRSLLRDTYLLPFDYFLGNFIWYMVEERAYFDKFFMFSKIETWVRWIGQFLIVVFFFIRRLLLHCIFHISASVPTPAMRPTIEFFYHFLHLPPPTVSSSLPSIFSLSPHASSLLRPGAARGGRLARGAAAAAAVCVSLQPSFY